MRHFLPSCFGARKVVRGPSNEEVLHQVDCPRAEPHPIAQSVTPACPPDVVSCNASAASLHPDDDVQGDPSLSSGPSQSVSEEQLLQTLPFSWAVLTSDARTVLQHHLGQEPAAAQICSQALCSSSSLPRDSASGAQHGAHPTSASGAQHGAHPTPEGAPSFLAALLGPRLEAAALKRTLEGRPWKGTICMQLLATEHPSSAHCDTHTLTRTSAAAEEQKHGGTDVATCMDAEGGSGKLRGSSGCQDAGFDEKSKCRGIQRRFPTEPDLSSPAFPAHSEMKGTRDLSNTCQSGVEMAHDRPEEEVGRLLNEGGEEGPTNQYTLSFLKSLSCKRESPAKHRAHVWHSDQAEHFAQQNRSHSAFTSSAALDPEVKGFDKTSDLRSLTERQAVFLPHPQLGSVGGSNVYSFDVTVSLLDHPKGKRSPIMVMICDSTEHLRVRKMLTALAESQLELLASIMPQHAIQFLAMESSEAVPEHVGHLARAHKSATLLFMDVCGFTAMAKEVEPVQVMVFLNTLFSHFDELVDIHGVHKVETAGDCYVVSGGIMEHTADGFWQTVIESHDAAKSAHRVMEFAKAILDFSGQVVMPHTQQPVRIRIGIHTGDVVSGMIGTKLPKFSLFGDAMNTASRMESTGVPGRIHVSKATHDLLRDDEGWEATGGVEVKGKGCMETYLWVPQRTESSGGQHFGACLSDPPLPGLRNAQQPLWGHTSPLPALCSVIHLIRSSTSSRTGTSSNILKEWEKGWETNGTSDSRLKTFGQLCLDAMATTSAGKLPSVEAAQATQSRHEACSIPLPAFMSSVPTHVTKRPVSCTAAHQQGV